MVDAAGNSKRQFQQYKLIHAAFRAGAFDTLTALLGSSRWFDEPLPWGTGGDYPLAHAIQWSPLGLVSAMLRAGATPNFPVQSFPALSIAMGAGFVYSRGDYLDILRLLLAAGADPNARGAQDWTPLHYAVQCRDAAAIRLLLAAGADPHLATRTDPPITALDEARRKNFNEGIALLEAAMA